MIHAAFRGSAHHYDLCHTERPGHATELAATGVSAGREVVVAVGGGGGSAAPELIALALPEQ